MRLPETLAMIAILLVTMAVCLFGIQKLDTVAEAKAAEIVETEPERKGTDGGLSPFMFWWIISQTWRK